MKKRPNQQEHVKHPMVHWYNPALLFRIALRSLIATVVRQIVDNRDIQAALNPVGNDELKGAYDYSQFKETQDFWFDYVADIGDGWDSTYAVASLLAKPALTMDSSYRLERGYLLIMGGDEVYPDPSVKAYHERMVAPYTAASLHAYMDQEPSPPHLFALPGNHDWLDGLHAFNNIFCQSRGHSNNAEPYAIGSWVTCQKRSYFSLKLPHSWWLCGVDVQLDVGINTTQIDYFRGIAQSQMKAGDRLILCCETPEWLLSNTNQLERMKSFVDILDVLTPSGIELRLILAGDIHHYNRYKAEGGGVEFITSGGGGAFLHPTHKLPESIGEHSQEEPPLTLQTCYPNKEASRKRSGKLLLFPFQNWDFTMLIGLVYSLMAWVFEARTLSLERPMSSVFMSWLSGITPSMEALSYFFITIPRTPEFAIILIVLYIGFIKFNFCKRLSVSIGLGFAHAMAHFIPFILAYVAASYMATPNINEPIIILGGLYSFLIFIATMFVISSLLGGLVFGLYLWVALNYFGLHWTNSFSALRINDYRNFLRMHISDQGDLTIYPLKIDKVSRYKNHAELIENSIVIK